MVITWKSQDAFTWLLGLVLIATIGCASYRRVETSSSARSYDANAMEEGVNVRVVLRTGEMFTGKIVQASNEGVTLDGLGNYGESHLVFAAEEIACVETRQQSDGQIEEAWFILMGVAAVTAFLLAEWGLN